MIYLRQSTASQEIPLGYFLDSADGNTEETGLTIANTDIKLWKAGATTLANKNSGGATHISNGIYYAVLDATDTDTLGSMVVFVHVAGALAIRLECVVLAANVYDSMIAASDNLQIDLVQAGGSAISQSGGLLNANVTQISGDSTAADNFETMLDGTGGQTLSLGQLNIVNSAGSAIVASSTGGNGHGIAASGNGSGEGISATGGTTGHGMELIGGATSGNGLTTTATAGNSHGILATGQGSGEGASLLGGATGHGLEATGGASSGNGINAAASAGNGHGLNVAGQGSGHGLNATGGATGNGIDANGGATSGDGINAAATTSGDGMQLAGLGAANNGLKITSGSSSGISATGGSNGDGMSLVGAGFGSGLGATGGSSSGSGINATGGSTNGNGINASSPGSGAGFRASSITGNGATLVAGGNGHGMSTAGAGSGHGLNATGGATGNGIDANGGATSGNGIDAAAPTLGDGMQLAGAGGGLDLDATVNEFTQAAMAQFFTTDSGQTYGTSVAGSVVKEIADNAGGGGLSQQDVRDAMKLAPTAGAPDGGSIDDMIATVETNTQNIETDTQDIQARLPAALVSGRMDSSVGEMQAAALGQFFTVDSGETFGTTVAGSVVRETAANATVASIGSSVLNDIADAILRRDWTAVAAPASRSVMNALRAIRNRVALAAGTMTVYQEDDATPAFTATVMTDAAADPITEIDPT